jgi:hypothetical protein
VVSRRDPRIISVVIPLIPVVKPPITVVIPHITVVIPLITVVIPHISVVVPRMAVVIIVMASESDRPDMVIASVEVIVADGTVWVCITDVCPVAR